VIARTYSSFTSSIPSACCLLVSHAVQTEISIHVCFEGHAAVQSSRSGRVYAPGGCDVLSMLQSFPSQLQPSSEKRVVKFGASEFTGCQRRECAEQKGRCDCSWSVCAPPSVLGGGIPRSGNDMHPDSACPHERHICCSAVWTPIMHHNNSSPYLCSTP